MNEIIQALREKAHDIKEDFFMYFWLAVLSILLLMFSVLIVIYILCLVKELIPA